MERYLSIDFGVKRTGLAVTDLLQIIASGLDTVATPDLLPFLKDYCSKEPVTKIIIGDSTKDDGTHSHITTHIRKLKTILEKEFPEIEISFFNEKGTSIKAVQAMIQAGVKKMKRRDKALIDKVSAVLILQEYLETTKYSR